jgi:hypothetical protein
MNFSDVHSRWGIVQNYGDVFRGDRMVILYDPGEFPALLPDKHGKLQFRNGGVPQEGDLTRHLSKLRAQVDELVPDHNFQGNCILHVVSSLGGSHFEYRSGNFLSVAFSLSGKSACLNILQSMSPLTMDAMGGGLSTQS